MKELVLACSMMEDEIALAMKNTGYSAPIVYLERALHEHPEKLRAKLNEQLESVDAERVLLAFGLCGNALAGVKCDRAELVVPKFDDCIRLLLCREKGRCELGNTRALYYTGGWVRADNFLLAQYRRFAERRGEKKAAIAYGAMFANYKEIRLIDTGAYCLEDCFAPVKEAAELLKLGFGTEKGTVRVLEKLFRREWDDEFLVVPTGRELTQDDFLRRFPENG